MKLKYFETRMEELAAGIINELGISKTMSISRAKDTSKEISDMPQRKRPRALAFSNGGIINSKDGIINSHSGVVILITTNEMVPGKYVHGANYYNVPEIPDGHSLRDLFFLIHEEVNKNNNPREVKCSPYAKIHETARIGDCDGIAIFRYYHRRITIKHMGGVVIEKGVEIDANTCIPPGVLDDTLIKSYAKIGYNCNIGHGSTIGENTVVVDGTTIGGSCDIGRDCWLGMNSTIREGLKIANKVLVGMGAVVTHDLTMPGKYYGVPARVAGPWDGGW